MASSNRNSTGNLSEEQVHCSICLDVFTNPVSIPCGHNFCQGCILGYWKTSPLYQCPMCKKTFYKRPDISINTVLREIAEQFKEVRVRDAQREQQKEAKAQKEVEKLLKEAERKLVQEQRKKEDEQRLLQREQQDQLVLELKQRQEEERQRQGKKGSMPGDGGPDEGLPVELPPLEPPAPPLEAPPAGPPTPPGQSPVPAPHPAPPPASSAPPSPSPSTSSTPSTPSSSQNPWSAAAAAAAEEEGVFCDVCLGDEGGRPRAVKSCLVCLTSYCEEHLRSHSARFSKHKLMEPVANLEDRMCPRHERLLELYCKKDQQCVCVLCTETDHRAHYTVPVEREWMEKKVQLKRAETDVKQMIQARLQKVEEIKQSVELNKASAQREMEEGAQVFAELVRSIRRSQAELVLAIEEKQRETESRALELVAQLEQEISELSKRNADLDRLSRSDHIHFLQSFPALSVPPPTKDWSETSVHTEMCVGIIRRAVSKLEDTLSEQMDKLVESELKKIPKYTVDLTLDPDSANPWLQLSEDRRQVRHLGAWQDLPDHPERFDTVVIVLGREGFASGRHYWEVQVGDKDDWYLGVARASVKRKGRIAVSVTQGYWALAMKKGGAEYRASTAPPLLLSLDSKPQRVGVYVDYEEGQVSFYDVGARSHIHTFADSFREKVYPFFYLYCCDKASDSMVLCPVIDRSPTKQC